MLNPQWESDAPEIGDESIAEALANALDSEEGTRLVDEGDLEAAFAGGGGIGATYSVGLAAHAAIEPLTATARVEGDRIEIWAPAQAPGTMREAIARALGWNPESITIYPMLVGGGFGRKLEHDAAVQAAIIARRINRPVQLAWSREEETRSAYHRPAALARLTGMTGPNRTEALHSRIAVPSAGNQATHRIMPAIAFGDVADASQAAVDGARPAYAIPNLMIDHMPVDIGVECGIWRSEAHSYTAFFTESFVDELARHAGAEPLSYRIAMLGREPRLARCLTAAATLGNWDGGEAGGGMGIAAHSAFGSHVAMVVQLHLGEEGPEIERVSAAVDCGRVINPEIVKQQVEGGIVWGIQAALGGEIRYAGGEPVATNFDRLSMPRLADTPRIDVEIIDSGADPGGVGELAVPPVGPAIGNAIFAATGRRLRRLPFRMSSEA